MNNNCQLKLFISYCHMDENYITEFRKFLTSLKYNNTLKDWHDRRILAGEDFQKDIDQNFENADLICLCISQNFLNSASCRAEIKTALRLQIEKNTIIIPIILSSCSWLDEQEIKHIQALPKDGNPIAKFPDKESAWMDVYDGIKNRVNYMVDKKSQSITQNENLVLVKNVQLTKEFSSFLQKVEILENTHSKKTTVVLEDIFVYPELDKYDPIEGEQEEQDSEDVINNFTQNNISKILIVGSDQSGKTTLCKQIFSKLRNKNYFPIYISDKDTIQTSNLESKILNCFQEQYENLSIEEVDKKRIIPIFDNFHLVLRKYKKRYIEHISSYPYQVVTVDDVFNFSLEDEALTSSFTQFKIKEFTPPLRDKMLRKWINLSDNRHFSKNEIEILKDIDEKTELVNFSLGSGIMPSYPFFIISIISIHEMSNPLDKITSQGHCYQALIFMSLTKQGVDYDKIGIYINFLTELAFFFYQENKTDASEIELKHFLDNYQKKYYLPIKIEELLTNLRKAKIITLNSLSNYSFSYEYIYYFFVAKYLAEDPEKHRNLIERIIANLHKDENAYITIFISHHSKDISILDTIILNALFLFDSYQAATLSKNELVFFDEQSNEMADAVLSAENRSNQTRERRLEISKAQEKNYKTEKKKNKSNPEDDFLENNLRRSIKTVEVMGRILKNRSGSLEKKRLEEILEQAIEVHLRILTSFLDTIRDEERREALIGFVTDKVDKLIKKKDDERHNAGKKIHPTSNEDIKKLSKKLFWNINFYLVCTIIEKIISSVGSNQLLQAVEVVANKKNTPAYFLIKHGINMWYSKNIQIDNIAVRINKDHEFSEVAKRVMKLMIMSHCSMHPIEFNEKQKISSKIGIALKNFKQ